jgi:ubiquinone/menaquinone biosynthesis C-methylase UbiE
MAESEKFWDKIAERYARSPVANEAAYQEKLALTRQYLGTDFEVLELACGTGSTAIALAGSVKHIRAIDISSNMLRIAGNKAADAGVENVSFEHSSIDALQSPLSSYDAVLAHSILHLVDDTTRVIKKTYDLLKPGGYFFSSTICLGDSKLRFLKVIAPIAKLLNLMPDVFVFSAQELRADFAQIGFEVVHEWLPGPRSALFLIARKPG